MKNTYSIYLNNKIHFAGLSGTEYAYEVYRKVRELAELLNVECFMVWEDSAHVLWFVEEYDPEEEED